MGRLAIEGLLERLYDADFSQPCFEPFMHELGQRLQSHVLALHTYDVARSLPTMVNAVGVDAELKERADDTAGDNLWFQRGAAQLLGEGMADDESLVGARELHRSRFHADFLHPADLEHGMGLYLGQDGDDDGSMVVMTINRSGRFGHFTDGERALARALLPHLRNAFALHGRLRGLSASERAYRDTLDRLDQPLVLLTAQGSVAFANERAQRLEAAGSCLQRRQGRLSAVHPADDALLQAALLRVLSGDTGGEPLAMPLRARDGTISALLTLCPARDPVFDPWAHDGVAAAIFVRPLAPRLLADDVRAAFALTPAEFRLAGLLLQGLALEPAAAQLGITKNTVRTQLRGLFEKTGTHRQSELVALLHRAS
jgi:DNA-binding CsgD family transcriptional regulator/PAS domain-containing protein